MSGPTTYPPHESIRTTSTSKARARLPNQAPSLSIKRTISEDCTRDADSGRPPKYHCLRKEVERRERRLLGVVNRASISTPMPGQQKMQMDVKLPGQMQGFASSGPF
ncbi:uncharacterized protein BDV17DRAFT_110892 [Aspergillus undulatus]|uniref:uncharacterized protein n=1 Tax=Aspergillus undulatus TaxID=1810928 RepID=UPI003CCCE16E